MARLLGIAIGALLCVAALTFLFSWVVAGAAVYGLYRLGRRLWRAHRARTAAAAHRRAELLARAEIQHRWYLDGDPRGIYGRYPPAAAAETMGLRGGSRRCATSATASASSG